MDMFDYAQMDDNQVKKVNAIKEKARELLALFDEAFPAEQRSDASRLMNIARTNLEQSIMWAVKAVSRFVA